jgi:hypothetical protein
VKAVSRGAELLERQNAKKARPSDQSIRSAAEVNVFWVVGKRETEAGN